MASLRRSSRLAKPAVTGATLTEEASAIRAESRSRKRKPATSVSAAADEPEAAALPAQPSTPSPQKRRRGRPSKETTPETTVAAVTATVAAVATSVTVPSTPTKPRHAAVSRLANPEGTNAQLVSPRTSRVIAALPADRQAEAPAVTTTENILETACAHLIAVDPRMKPLIDAHYCHVFGPEGLAEKVDPFERLTSSIISQQVSGAAARSIKARFIALFEDLEEQAGRRFPSPAQVAATPLERLRTAGLSQRKAEYVQGLAEKFASGELTAQLLAEASYETLVERLVAVRGLGRWSVEMFALFGLKRMDVFSVGDLGVQRGMAAFVGRDVAKLKTGGKGKWKYMTDKEMEALSEPFRPYRSVFMWYMWRVEETDVSTLEA